MTELVFSTGEALCVIAIMGVLLLFAFLFLREMNSTYHAFLYLLPSLVVLLTGRREIAETLEFPGFRRRKKSKYMKQSRATAAKDAIKAIEGFSGPVMLMAGGGDSEGDFSALARAARGRVREAVLIGKPKKMVTDSLGGITGHSFVRDFDEAVRTAAELACSADFVVLSPVCGALICSQEVRTKGNRANALLMEL